MTFEYELETRNGTINYELETTYEETKNALIEIISLKTPKELFEIMEELTWDEDNLWKYFFDDLEEYFEEEAKQRYENSKQQEEDYIFDYFNDKL